MRTVCGLMPSMGSYCAGMTQIAPFIGRDAIVFPPFIHSSPPES